MTLDPDASTPEPSGTPDTSGDESSASVATAAPSTPAATGTTANHMNAVEPEPESEPAEQVGSGARALVDWIVVVAVALTVAFLVRGFLLAHFVVDGSSMDSTLATGDRVFVNKLSYRLHDPNRGDVVVLHQINGTAERDLIKRVIALPGETIEMTNCEVRITEVGSTDSRVLVEPYLDLEVITSSCGGDFSPIAVPDNHVFVMGDNRSGSQDSRSPSVGPVAFDDLVGRAFVVFWPRSDWRWL